MATQARTITPAGELQLPRLALQLDGAVSGATGVGMLVGAAPVADFTGLPLAASIAVGAGLIAYGIVLFLLARRPARGALLAIAAGNVAWVIGSALVLLTGWPPLTTAGGWAVGIVALAVADFAALQVYAARKAR